MYDVPESSEVADDKVLRGERISLKSNIWALAGCHAYLSDGTFIHGHLLGAMHT